MDATDQHKENDMQKLIIMTVMAVAMVASVSRGMVSADDEKKVDIKGLETFETNALFLSNLRLAPENIKVEKGDTVTWKDDALTSVPHTITIFDPKVLPVDFATAYICNWDKRILGVDGPCLQFIDAHAGIPPTTPVVNAGRSGLDVAGESMSAAAVTSCDAPLRTAMIAYGSTYMLTAVSELDTPISKLSRSARGNARLQWGRLRVKQRSA